MQADIHNLLLFVDWLGLSLRLVSEPVDIPNHIWREYPATNVWAKRRILYNEYGDKVLTLLSEPRSSKIPSNAALLEIENQWLYHGLRAEGVVELLQKACYFEITGISRVDLCVDFTPTWEQHDVIMGLSDKRYYVQGKQNTVEFCSTNRSEKLASMWRGKRIPHQQSWGHKTSDVKWKLYYKTKELYDEMGGKFMGKPYIVDWWRIGGLDISNVWRLEVSIKHGNNFEFDGSRVDFGLICDKIEDLYKSLYCRLFKIRADEGHRDKSNDRIVQFLDIEKVDEEMRRKRPKSMAEHNGRISLLRMLVKSLDDETVVLDAVTRNAVFTHMESIIKHDHLQNYFLAMTGQWFEEYKDNIEVFVHQRWAVRDVRRAQDSVGTDGSSDLDRSLRVARLDRQEDMHPNIDFDAQKTDAADRYYQARIDELGLPKERIVPKWERDGLFGGK